MQAQIEGKVGFETGELDGKNWEQVIDEFQKDIKNELLEKIEKKQLKVPKTMIVNVLLNFFDNART